MDLMVWSNWLAPFYIGYLFGSIPFGLLITKAGGAGDVRSIGSGNIGATNVLRTGRKGLAAATLLADTLKGAIVVWFYKSGSIDAAALAAFGAFVGHLFPVWLKFKGGKGIAVYIGALIAISWIAALVFAAVWLSTALIARYSSLASLLATIAAPVALYLLGPGLGYAALAFAIMTLLAWIMHRANIGRLLSGTEGKIGAIG